MPYDKAEQVPTDATMLKSWEKCKYDYFSIGVVAKAVANDRFVLSTNKAGKRARPDIVCPGFCSDSHRCQTLGRDRVLARLTTQNQAGGNIVCNRKSTVHPDALNILHYA